MSEEEKSFIKEFKLGFKIFIEKLSKRNLPLISSFIIAVCLPWFLTFLILIFSGVWSELVSSVSNDGGLLFSMIVFYSFNFTFDFPLLGNGFWLVSLIWSITGLALPRVIDGIQHYSDTFVDGVPAAPARDRSAPRATMPIAQNVGCPTILGPYGRGTVP